MRHRKKSCRIYRHTCAKLSPDQVLFVQEVEENLVIAQGLDLIEMTSSRFHLSCKVFSVHIHPSERTFTDILPCSTVATGRSFTKEHKLVPLSNGELLSTRWIR
jgi:hypothetical protein